MIKPGRTGCGNGRRIDTDRGERERDTTGKDNGIGGEHYALCVRHIATEDRRQKIEDRGNTGTGLLYAVLLPVFAAGRQAPYSIRFSGPSARLFPG
jgi:hypothetical protein